MVEFNQKLKAGTSGRLLVAFDAEDRLVILVTHIEEFMT